MHLLLSHLHNHRPECLSAQTRHDRSGSNTRHVCSKSNGSPTAAHIAAWTYSSTAATTACGVHLLQHIGRDTRAGRVPSQALEPDAVLLQVAGHILARHALHIH